MSVKPKGSSYSLRRDHFTIFGSIIHLFARVEWHMQLSLAAVAKIDLDKALILTKELSYRQKRDTLYSYMTLTANTTPYVKDCIRGFLDEIDTYNALRNNIARRKASRFHQTNDANNSRGKRQNNRQA
jgi:hypothetical protein